MDGLRRPRTTQRILAEKAKEIILQKQQVRPYPQMADIADFEEAFEPIILELIESVSNRANLHIIPRVSE